jgi:plasmid stabilization system protein ParE
MILTLSDAAAAEALDAARWYEGQRPGLGDEFVTALVEASAQIARNPRAWPVWPGLATSSPPVQRYLIQHFPYALAYQVFDGHIDVIAVAHTSRRPGYWR